MSAGSRSLVNWMRLNSQAQHPRHRIGQRGLAHPGQILDQQVAAGQQARQGDPDLRFLADQHRADRRDDRIQFCL